MTYYIYSMDCGAGVTGDEGGQGRDAGNEARAAGFMRRTGRISAILPHLDPPFAMSDSTIQHVSDTAFLIAHFRAAESARRDALFHDPQAWRLAGE
jgi:hypothetical protein